MKKRLCVILALVLTLSLGAFAGCGGNKPRNNEKDPLRLSTLPVEGLFSPFYATAATDTAVTGRTQISMFTTDDNAKIVCGDDWPCVAKDYSQTMYDAEGNPTTVGDENGTTVYQFVIKNGIKFSDGVDLTIKDVLFNVYMYLDPVYTGSSTLYSVDIEGLKLYRSLGIEVGDNEDSPIDTTAAGRAAIRLSNLNDWLTTLPENSFITEIKDGDGVEKAVAQAEKDAKALAELFRAEIETDWVSAGESLESYQKEYDVKQQWEVYLFTENVTSVKLDPTGRPIKNAAGKYVIDTTAIDQGGPKSHNKEDMINFVYGYYQADNLMRGYSNKFADILAWASGSQLRTNIEAEERSNVIAEYQAAGDYPRTVSGISVVKGTEFVPSADSIQKTAYGSEYDVLQVRIKGVDPKALWNFGLTIAPMHYYSDASVTDNSKYNDKNDYHAFNAPGTEGYDGNEDNINFGFPMGDYKYMTEVVQARNKVPMGAGVYKATDLDKHTDFNNLKKGFYNSGTVYYVRNDYFYTTMKNGTDKSLNAKIKYLRCKEIDTANVMNAFTSRALDFSDGVAAKPENQTALSKTGFVGYATARTNGYGYIGINAEKIPNINLRRAIMSVFDASLIKSYYPGTLSETITRCLSTCSWVYNFGEQEGVRWEPEAVYKFDASNPDLTDYNKYMDAARDELGLTRPGGGNWYNPSEKKPLKYTFTISGGSEDHPAYQTMYKAMEVLNDNGWQISVNTDSRALSKLSSGGLTVWCAAWSATVDPDMYQIYHMDSKATNVNAWGYPDILKRPDSEDYQILEELSTLIDNGRKKLEDVERAPIYQEALDKLMDLAIEFPLYQRCDLYAWNTDTLDVSTINTKPSTYAGPIDRLWEVSFKK